MGWWGINWLLNGSRQKHYLYCNYNFFCKFEITKNKEQEAKQFSKKVLFSEYRKCHPIPSNMWESDCSDSFVCGLKSPVLSFILIFFFFLGISYPWHSSLPRWGMVERRSQGSMALPLELLLNQTQVCSPVLCKDDLLSPGYGEGKCSVYWTVPNRESGTASAPKVQTPHGF